MTAGDIVEKLPAKQAESAEKSNSASERLADHLSDENYIEQQDQQLRDIEQETKMVPLIGPKIPFDVVVQEYTPHETPEFYFKASDLSDTYAWIRPMRRDGNCFYRAVLAAQVERIVRDPDELRRFDAVCKGWKDRLLRLGFQEMTTTDFCDVFYELLNQILAHELTLEQALTKCNQDEYSNYYVIFLRLVASGYLKEHADEYAPFIDNGLPLEQYCAQEIETMWRDVDHLAIQGLVSGLGLSLRIEYLDQTAVPNGGTHYDIPADPAHPPPVVLLYRPGHYDLIFRR
ncbi:unnamed protein product, partial [Mesorhabditis spiculigera]